MIFVLILPLLKTVVEIQTVPKVVMLEGDNREINGVVREATAMAADE